MSKPTKLVQAKTNLRLYMSSLRSEINTVSAQTHANGDIDSIIAMLALIEDHVESALMQAEEIQALSQPPTTKLESLVDIRREMGHMKTKIICLEQTRERDAEKIKRWQSELREMQIHYGTIARNKNVVELVSKNA